MVDTVVVAAALAQRPRRAGHAWVVLNWMAGFRQLGYRVVFVDRIDESMGDVGAGVAWVAEVMDAAGFEWSVITPGSTDAGLSTAARRERAGDALLLNVMGYVRDPELFDVVGARVLLDIDPGFGQAWQQAGQAEVFSGHDHYATVGLNVGTSDCLVPDLGLRWISTLPPVDLTAWPTHPAVDEGAWTTVASWRGPFAPVEIHGALHGLRAHQARLYADLPRRTGARMELALDIDPSDEADRRRLLAGCWTLCDPNEVAGDLGSYARYVAASKAEFSVAKQLYVSLRTGWFSDRSGCYLASGRPVVVSDTGLHEHLPVGEGLLTYTTPDEAADAVAEVEHDLARHVKAARDLAEEHLAAPLVAGRLIERIR